MRSTVHHGPQRIGMNGQLALRAAGTETVQGAWPRTDSERLKWVKHSETNQKAMTFQYFSRTKFQTRNFSDNVRPHDSLLDSVANLSQTLLPLRRFLGQELEPTSTDCCRCSHNWVVLNMLKWVIQWPLQTSADKRKSFQNGYGSIPIHTIFRGMNIHLPAILMFTRGIGFWPIPK